MHLPIPGPATPKTLLHLTNSEYGQAQIHLALLYELSHIPNLTLHIGSLEPLRERLNIFNGVDLPKLGSNHLHFHALSGPPMTSNFFSAANIAKNMHPPATRGIQYGIQGFKQCTTLGAYLPGEDWMRLVQSCVEVIEDVKPDLVLLDPLFYCGIDACTVLGQEFMEVVPISLTASVGLQQPWGRAFWKFPCPCTGLPAKLPWYLIPKNIILFICIGIFAANHPRCRELTAYRAAHGITTPLPWLDPNKYRSALIGTHTELEVNDLFVPEGVHPVGPMMLPIFPLAQTDQELAAWLNRKGMRTVFVNMGSHDVTRPEDAMEFAKAFKRVLSTFADVQVLWKYKRYDPAATSGPNRLLAEELSNDRIRIVHWLTAAPVAILKTPRIACWINHGGANFFYEGIVAGAPQVVLPIWFDTYDNGALAEGLGIGVWGSKRSAPYPEAEELGDAIDRVLSEEEFARKAKWAAEIVRRKGEGRFNAARKVVERLEELEEMSERQEKKKV